MEITQEHESLIKEIMSEMQCPYDFECYKSGFENLSKINIFGNGITVECLEEKANSCKFSLSFESGYMCKCPLRKYIAQNFKI